MFSTTQIIDQRLALVASCVFALSSIFGASTAVAKDPFGGEFNHYQCYNIVDGGSGLEAKLKLSDQFGDNVGAIVRPVMLCNPVDKNGEGIPAKEVHLVCYTIEAEKSQKHVVAIQNQLEEAKYWVNGPQMLCVPSTKEILE